MSSSISQSSTPNASAKNIDPEFYNQIKETILDILGAERTWSYAEVQEYDKDTHSVRVLLLPNPSDAEVNFITGFIPLLTPWMGSGWGMQCAPIAKQAYVLVFMQSNVFGPAYAIGPFFNRNNLAPNSEVAIEDGEFLLRHSSGSYVVLRNDSSIMLKHKDGTYIELDSGSNVNVIAEGKQVLVNAKDVEVNATSSVVNSTQVEVNATTVAINSAATVDVISPLVTLGSSAALQLLNTLALAKYNAHTHPGGSGNPPNPQMVPLVDTTVLTKAS